MLSRDGIATQEDIKTVMPGKDRLLKGPVAVAECYERIPCNPCYYSCKRGAFQPFADINDKPKIDHEKCNGCGLCMTNCPGLAIFVLDFSYSDTEALVKIPYEFIPLPAEGEVVDAVNRAGEIVGKAKVVKVQAHKNLAGTNLITLAVPKELGFEVRHFKRKG